jgi:hypothetical protein
MGRNACGITYFLFRRRLFLRCHALPYADGPPADEQINPAAESSVANQTRTHDQSCRKFFGYLVQNNGRSFNRSESSARSF